MAGFSRKKSRSIFGFTSGVAFSIITFAFGFNLAKALCTCGYLPPIQNFPNYSIASFGTLLTIFLTISTLTYNLGNRLPERIIDKYLRYNKFTWFYFGSLICSLIISIFGFYHFNSIFSFYSLILSLTTSILLTAFFFYWFIKRTSKKGIYDEIRNKMQKELSGEESELNFDKVDNLERRGQKQVAQFTRRPKRKINKVEAEIEESESSSTNETISSSYFQENPKTRYWHSDEKGEIDLQYDKLEKLIKKIREDDAILSLEILENNHYVHKTEEVLRIKAINKSKKDLEDEYSISKVFKIKEEKKDDFATFKDWLACMRHSCNKNPEHLDDDFEELRKVIDESDPKGRSKKIFEELKEEIGNNSSSTKLVLENAIDLIYKLRANKLLSIEESEKKPPKTHDLKASQQTLAQLFKSYENKLEGYDERYAIAILHMNEMIRYDFKKEFEISDDEYNEQYHDVMVDSIDTSTELIYHTLNNSFKNPKFYNKYLDRHLEDFLKILEHYRPQNYN